MTITFNIKHITHFLRFCLFFSHLEHILLSLHFAWLCFCLYEFSRTATSPKLEVCLVTLAGWLEVWLLWAGSPGTIHAGTVLGQLSWSGCKLGCLRVLCIGVPWQGDWSLYGRGLSIPGMPYQGILAQWLEQRWKWARYSQSTSCRRHPAKFYGAKWYKLGMFWGALCLCHLGKMAGATVSADQVCPIMGCHGASLMGQLALVLVRHKRKAYWGSRSTMVPGSYFCPHYQDGRRTLTVALAGLSTLESANSSTVWQRSRTESFIF